MRKGVQYNLINNSNPILQDGVCINKYEALQGKRWLSLTLKGRLYILCCPHPKGWSYCVNKKNYLLNNIININFLYSVLSD